MDVGDMERKPQNPNQFGKQDRVLRPTDFTRVYDQGEYSADDTLVVKAAVNDRSRTRLGLSISRQVGNAVVRNRWKRLIREAFRTSREQIPRGLDVVVRPRKNATPDFHRIGQSLIVLTNRIEKRIRKLDN